MRLATPVLLASLFSAPVLADVTDSIVTIYAKTSTSTSSQGTGFIFSSSGRILTAYHVIQNAVEIDIRDKNLSRLVDVKVERIDERRDLAILTYRQTSHDEALRLSGSGPTPYSDVRIAGCPRGLPKQVLYGKGTSAGYVQSTSISSAGGKRVFDENIDVIPIDVTVYSGMSGAPVITENNRVIGILSGSFDEGRGVAWAIPVKYVDELIQKPPINRVVDGSFRWPDLKLMSRNWITLKRSYGRSFDAVHIAQLESLEGLYRALKGTWSGETSQTLQIHSDFYFGECSYVARGRETLTIHEVSQDGPAVKGAFKSEGQVRTTINYAQQDNSAKDRLHKLCQISPGTTDPTAPVGVSMDGSVNVSSSLEEDSSTGSERFITRLNIVNCRIKDTDECPAGGFGNKNAGRLEVISDTKIRWRGVILTRIYQ
jgi:S1-C subfamily serine protease